MFEFNPTHWLVTTRTMGSMKCGVPVMIQFRYRSCGGIHFYLDGGRDRWVSDYEIQSLRTLEECVPQGAD